MNLTAPGAGPTTPGTKCGAAKTPEKIQEVSPVGTPVTPEVPAIDARIKTKQFAVCGFGGHEFSESKHQKCKFYDQSYGRWCCFWYADDICTEEHPCLGICTKLLRS